MRLLFLCERMDAEGGMETYLRTIIPLLDTRDCTIRIVARVADPSADVGVPCETLPWSDEHDPSDPAAARRIHDIIAEFGPDAVAVHNVLDAGVLEAARGARRLVYHLHDHRPFCPNGDRLYPQGGKNCTVAMGAACLWHSLVHGCAYGPRPQTVRLIALRERVRDAVRASDAIVVLSRYMQMLAVKNGCDAGRVRVVPAPLPPGWIEGTIAPPPQAPAVFFAGRLLPSKGLRSLVRAIGLIDGAGRPSLAVAGEGPDLAAAVDEAGRCGVTLRYLGKLNATAMRAAIDAATVAAVPSLWAEPFGLIGIEAQARGRPVVAYDVGGIPDWLERGGELVTRGDERELAAAIVRLCEPKNWSVQSTAARENVLRYEASEHISQLMQLYAGASPIYERSPTA
ncbi:MAG: glycosyltransferase [Vulcanimicrobiaceae bacterium]